MKKILIALLLAVCMWSCSSKKEDTLDCKIYWQLYHTPKYLEETEIEKAYQETFYGFYTRLNDNTVIARNTNVRDVRSLTLKLASMAHQKLEGRIDPRLDYQVELRVYIDFAGKYVEEVWNQSY